MSPESVALFQKFIELVNDGNIFLFLLFMLIMNLPGIIAWVIQLFGQRALTSVWKARCDDKDREIDRLAKTVKEFQNKLLKSQRT